MVVGYVIFSKMYYYADAFLKFESWIQIATASGYSAGYSGITGETNRLTFITFMNERFLLSPIEKLFGLGLGNCSFSTLSIFNTPFYKRYN